LATHSLTPDKVILNSNIITMDPNKPLAQAVAVNDGKFVAVGSNEDIKSLVGPKTLVTDLMGKTTLPGFIDSHTHVLSSGTRHVTEVDCDLRSLSYIKEALSSKASKTPEGEWVVGFKFDDTKTSEARFLNRQDLDQVSQSHPIMVAHQAGHVYFFNSKGLERAMFFDDSPNEQGGFLGRDKLTGDLNGMVYGRAIDRVLREVLPKPSTEDRRAGLELICKMFASTGITSVHDAMVSSEDLGIYQEFLEKGDLPIRAYLLMHRDHFNSLRDGGVRTGFGGDRLRIGGIKMVADGAISTRTAYLSEPYVGSEGERGLLIMDPEETDERVLEMHKSGFQVCIHANGDSAIDMVLSAYEKAQKAFPRIDPRHRIEHCSLVTEEILQRMKKIGCLAVPFGSYVYYHGEKMGFYGEQRLERMFAHRSFIDAGINASGAADYPCSPLAPLVGIQSCVTREDISRTKWGPSQVISVMEALKVYTLNGAYASFEENIKGSIEVGKLADMVILSADPNNVDPHEIKDIPVEMTIVGGETIHEV